MSGVMYWNSPNYCGCLNAMHDAERTLNEQAYRLFIGHLVCLLSPGCFSVHSTARQRAEAFLKTIGKWKE